MGLVYFGADNQVGLKLAGSGYYTGAQYKQLCAGILYSIKSV